MSRLNTLVPWRILHILVVWLIFIVNPIKTDENVDAAEKTTQQQEVPVKFDLENLNFEDTTGLYKPGAYGARCDIVLHNKFVHPIYNTTDVVEANTAKVALNEYLLKINDDEVSRSLCYGVVAEDLRTPLRETFLGCEETCEDILNPTEKYACCKCLHQEPFVYERFPHQLTCLWKASELGDPCDYEFSKDWDEQLKKFSNALVKAKTRGDYVLAIYDFAKEVNAYAEDAPNVKRLVCHSGSNNLECKKDGKCGCMDKGPYMKYVPHKNNRNCVGTKNAICYLEMSTELEPKPSYLEKLSECAPGLTCQEAVPGLYCENLDDKDCVFGATVVDTNTGENITDAFTLWSILACGGGLNQTYLQHMEYKNQKAICIIKEIYDSEDALEHFELELDLALKKGIPIIVIEPLQLAEQTGRWIAVGNFFHRAGVIFSLSSLIWNLTCPTLWGPRYLAGASFLCSSIYIFHWNLDPCGKYQVEQNLNRLKKLHIPHATSAVVLRKQHSGCRRLLHISVTMLSIGVCIFGIYHQRHEAWSGKIMEKLYTLKLRKPISMQKYFS